MHAHAGKHSSLVLSYTPMKAQNRDSYSMTPGRQDTCLQYSGEHHNMQLLVFGTVLSAALPVYQWQYGMHTLQQPAACTELLAGTHAHDSLCITYDGSPAGSGCCYGCFSRSYSRGYSWAANVGPDEARCPVISSQDQVIW